MTTSGTDPRYDALAELALGTLPEAERPAIRRRRQNCVPCVSRSACWR